MKPEEDDTRSILVIRTTVLAAPGNLAGCDIKPLLYAYLHITTHMIVLCGSNDCLLM